MQVTKGIQLEARLQNTIFTVLLVAAVGLVAWLSTHYEIKADWTINNRHSLSETSKKLLDELSGPITITAYVIKESDLRQIILELVERYQRHKADINLRFVDPRLAIAEVRERGVQFKDELIIDYQDRTEHMQTMGQGLSEQDLTEALQRVARTDNRLIVFLEGHGERSPSGSDYHDFSQWALALKNTGFEVQTLNFGKTVGIPKNTHLLVLASPRKKLLPGEINLIADYIDKGGNLLWFIEPTVPLQGLEAVADKFGLTVQPGVIVEDPMKSQMLAMLLGMSDPDPALVSISTNANYHPITSTLKDSILFPHVSGLSVEPPEEENWAETALLSTNPQAWSETEDIIEYNEKTDIAGPLDIAFALVRERPKTGSLDDAESDTQDDSKAETEDDSKAEIEDDSKAETEKNSKAETEEDSKADTKDKSEAEDDDSETEDDSEAQEQRVVIIGDGDFISNASIGFGGNLELGLKMMNWLTEDDAFIHIPAKTAVDLTLKLSVNSVILLGAFFLVILPLGLISTGISIWLRRRKA
jgi:ABC-type uncharacterized transport system involved in gliding motility auxiliary subunit